MIIDHNNHNISLLHYNPFLSQLLGKCGYRSVERDFMRRLVTESDRQLFDDISAAAYRYNAVGDNVCQYYSFNIGLTNGQNPASFYTLKIIPVALNDDRRLQCSLLIIEPAKQAYAGRLRLHTPTLPEKVHTLLPHPDRTAPLIPLTEISGTEQKILSFSATGMTESLIADKLALKATTLKQQKSAMFDKLGVKNITAAVAIAIRNHLID
ncbi:MAG: LuxR C-terminal-related transcriptional regulator [Bacteroidales bacterium]|nr:LuxR C-terminal-related transcriptional regulator [Bacteroidales bacterium]